MIMQEDNYKQGKMSQSAADDAIAS